MIVIRDISHNEKEVVVGFYDSVELKNRTVVFSWTEALQISDLASLKTKLEAIRQRMIFIETNPLG